jgi:tetratricopeptide (TPR) repeat protein
LLEQRDYEATIKALEQPAMQDTTGDSAALMAPACYQTEKYSQAANYYEAAVKLTPTDEGLRDMLAKARANTEAGIHVHVPEIYYFERNKLLEPTGGVKDALPTPPKPRREIWAERARRKIGSALGAVVSFIVNGVTNLWGAIAGYRDRV